MAKCSADVSLLGSRYKESTKESAVDTKLRPVILLEKLDEL